MFFNLIDYPYIQDSFESLCELFNIERAGFSDIKEILEVLAEFYITERLKKYGVIGIEIKLI